METASAAFVPRSKRWWPSSRRRRSGCHFRAFRENQSHILLTFVNPFNSFLRCFHDNFHHPCVRLEVQLGLRSSKIDEVSVMSSCFPFSWASFGCLGTVSFPTSIRSELFWSHFHSTYSRSLQALLGRPRFCLANRPFCWIVIWLRWPNTSFSQLLGVMAMTS